MKKIYILIKIPVFCFLIFLFTMNKLSNAMDDFYIIPESKKENWRIAISEGRRNGYHGKQLVDSVYKNLGDLPATYKFGNCSQLGMQLPEAGFDHLKISASAVEATKTLVSTAISTALVPAMGNADRACRIVKWISNQVSCSEINWGNAFVSGPIENTVVEIYTPLSDKKRHLLFSANINSYQVDFSDARWFGVDYKKVRMSNLQGDFGVLYFSTDYSKNLFH